MQTVSSTMTEIDQLAQRLGIDHESLKRAKARYKGEERRLLRNLKRQLTARERQAEQADKAEWEREQADLAIERHKATRQGTAAALKRQRKAMTLPQRLHAMGHKLTLLTGPAAASTQPSTGHGKPGSKIPPTVADPIDSDYYLQLIEDAIEQLERQLDAQDGLVTRIKDLTNDELEAEIITRWQGYRMTYVETLIPEVGSYKTVERARKKHGYEPIIGKPREIIQ